MKTLPEIQAAIEQLTTDEIRQLATWLTQHRESRWDEEMKSDVGAGRFDALSAELQSAYERGETEPFPTKTTIG